MKNTIGKIADANNIPVCDTIQKFLDDVQTQYDDNLGYESRIEKLKEQIGKVKIDYDRFSSSLFLNQFTRPALLRLF